MTSIITAIKTALNTKVKGFDIFVEGEDNCPFDETESTIFAIDSTRSNYIYFYGRNKITAKRAAGQPNVNSLIFESLTPYSLLVVLTNPKQYSLEKRNKIVKALISILNNPTLKYVNAIAANTDNLEVIRNEVKRQNKDFEDLKKFASVRCIRLDFEIKEHISTSNCDSFDFCDC